MSVSGVATKGDDDGEGMIGEGSREEYAKRECLLKNND